MKPFKRVLIANRGEIAIRIARAASALGIESVGVHAPVDAWSLHTRVVTEARELGEKRRQSGRGLPERRGAHRHRRGDRCDCVHPGYGFLAENAPFAQLCEANGLAFVGPGADALALFGDKVRARALAVSLDIPVVPGAGRRPDGMGGGGRSRSGNRLPGHAEGFRGRRRPGHAHRGVCR